MARLLLLQTCGTRAGSGSEESSDPTVREDHAGAVVLGLVMMVSAMSPSL